MKFRIGVFTLLTLSGICLAGTGTGGRTWKFAGEDRGMRFHFRENQCNEGKGILIRVENTLPRPVQLEFRVRDTDWAHRFKWTVPAMGIDSTFSFVPMDSAQVLYPYVDEVFTSNPGNGSFFSGL